MRKKKLLSLLLTAALVLTTVILPGSSVFAGESGQMQAQAVKSGTFQGWNTFKWTLDDGGTLKITGKGKLDVRLKDIKDIQDDVKKIVIGKGATEADFFIEDYESSYEDRKSGFPNLVSISLPATLKKLKGGLDGCENLATITGGENVEEINQGFFGPTKWLEERETAILGKTFYAYKGADKAVTIPDGIVTISTAAFQGSRTLESVTIPASVKTIERYAFEDCNKLNEIKGGSGIEHIETRALKYVPWLKDLTQTTMLGKVLVKYKGTEASYMVPTTVKQIYDGAFSGCSNLKTVTIKAKLKKIPVYAFENCKNLTKVTLPNTVTSIAYGAFDHCSALPEISLPSSLNNIDTGAFIFCESLSKVTVNKGANNLHLKSIGNAAFGSCVKLKSLTIPKKVDYIGAGAYGYRYDEDNFNWTQNPIKIENTTIIGVKGTQAETYAKTNGITFKAVKDDGTGSTGGEGGISGGPLVKGKSGTVVKAAGKKKNGLSAPGIELNIYSSATERTQVLHISKKVTGASGYQIFMSDTGKSGSWSSYKDKHGYDLYNDQDGKNKKTCYYKVRAYKKVNGKTVYGPYSKTMKIK